MTQSLLFTRSLRFTSANLFAAVGVVFLAVQCWILGRWIISDGVHVTFDSNADIGPLRAAVVWALQGALVAAFVGVVIVLVRQCRREHTITFDTAIAVGFACCAWQDPLLEWLRPTFYHSYYSLHFAPNWGPQLPGWDHPALHQPITLAIVPSGLGYPVMITCVWLQCWLADTVIRRRRRWKTARTLAAFTVAAGIVVLTFELILIGAGIYSYPLAIQSLSVWGGHWYQYPITEMLTWMLFLTAIAFMRSRPGARGTESPLSTAEVVGRTTALRRLLAGIGFTNALMITYVVVNVALTYFGGPIPQDTPSYLVPR
ncbi:spirocyclase AveC family protein [Nocardia brasiliensis]